jgi:penicillin-binding protein 1A
VAQQLVERYGPGATFGGGLHITTTIDPAMQQAAQQAIQSHLAGVGPTASAVLIDNKTGEVRAMVGGSDFQRRPFNLATNGHRQPGSAIKPFILATALEQGIGPGSVWNSAPKVFPIQRHGHRDYFVVHNFQDQYSGSITLADATAVSDNSVFAQVGLQVGTRRIARTARQMGIRTHLSTNPAMVLGGLKEGVTPLEMAYAYSTIANHGKRVSGTLAAQRMGPVAIEKVTDSSGHTIDSDHVKTTRVFSPNVADEMRVLLRGVVVGGTGTHAQVSQWAAGKTGTTENYGDAWFVGFTNQYTAAVWVGYPDSVKSMAHAYGGGPVEGGTFPADIWHDLMQSVIDIESMRHPGTSGGGTGPSSPVGPAAPQLQTTPQPQSGAGNGGTQQQQPQQRQQRQPQRTPAPPPHQPGQTPRHPQSPAGGSPPTGGNG